MPGAGSLFGALDIGISGLFASTMATQVLNHNITNANTPGYTRQSVTLSSPNPLMRSFGAIGRGVTILGVTRSADAYIEKQLWDQGSLLGEYDAEDRALSSIETILGSMDSNRIGDAMSGFFDAYSDLATLPVTTGKKEAVVQAAQMMTLQFREIDASLTELARDTRAALDDGVAEVNQLLASIASYNEMITANKTGDQLPNDLVDQRGMLLERLSELTGFGVHQRADGSLDVIVEGRTLVTRGSVNPIRIQLAEDAEGNHYQRAIIGDGAGVAVEFRTGEMAGLIRAANQYVPDVRQDLDRLVATLIDEVNALHRQGVGEFGTGIELFTGTGAGNVEVNPSLVENASLVVTGRTGAESDTELANEIAALRNAVLDSEGMSLTDLQTKLVVGLASERANVATLKEAQESVVDGVRYRLESARGVNVDEELAQLIQYQRAYEANARVISMVDEMLDTLINRMI